jgi:uncharacterized protein YcbX
MVTGPMSITVSALNYYPVKSCGGISVGRASIDDRGFELDRHWMIVDDRGYFVSQRTVPRLCLIKPSLDDKDYLRLNAPGMKPMPIRRDAKGESVQVTVWQDQCQAIDQGSCVADWLTEFAGVSCRLVRMADNFIRPVDRDYALYATDQVGFADGYSFLLISEESLADLNGRLTEKLPMNRFRPNIVVKGTTAFAEDKWQRIKIGNIIFGLVKPCTRCVTTTVNQETGEVGVEPLKTLAMFRRIDGGVAFGQNLVHLSGGKIGIGDAVEILAGK